MLFVESVLPAEFQGVRGVYQFSNSTTILKPDGSPLKSGLRVHLWFLLDRPIQGKKVAAWLEDYLLREGRYTVGLNAGEIPMVTFAIDTSLLKTSVQLHYTAAPVVGKGVLTRMTADEFVGEIPGDHEFLSLPEIDDGLESTVRRVRDHVRQNWAEENGLKTVRRQIRDWVGTVHEYEALLPREGQSPVRTGRTLR